MKALPKVFVCKTCDILSDGGEPVKVVRALDLYKIVPRGKVYYVCLQCETVYCTQRRTVEVKTEVAGEVVVKHLLCRRLEVAKIVSLFMHPIRYLRASVLDQLPARTPEEVKNKGLVEAQMRRLEELFPLSSS